MSDLRKLTEDDIVNRARQRDESQMWRDIANSAVIRPYRGPYREDDFSAHLLMERERCKTLMDKRRQVAFRVIDPNPKTHWLDPREEVRDKSEFEKDLIVQQQADQDTRLGYLLIGIAFVCFVAGLAWLVWG
jgi:hypothetical protein